MTPRETGPRPVNRQWMFEGTLIVLCVLYFVINRRTPLGSITDTVVALIGLVATLVLIWKGYVAIARRHEEDASFRRTLNRIEAYSVRPDASAGEAGVERLEQELRESSGVPEGRSGS